ncbi:hypothetical protein WG906_08870 [Pedobacter sp. P351]
MSNFLKWYLFDRCIDLEWMIEIKPEASNLGIELVIKPLEVPAFSARVSNDGKQSFVELLLKDLKVT